MCQRCAPHWGCPSKNDSADPPSQRLLVRDDALPMCQQRMLNTSKDMSSGRLRAAWTTDGEKKTCIVGSGLLLGSIQSLQHCIMRSIVLRWLVNVEVIDRHIAIDCSHDFDRVLTVGQISCEWCTEGFCASTFATQFACCSARNFEGKELSLGDTVFYRLVLLFHPACTPEFGVDADLP